MHTKTNKIAFFFIVRIVDDCILKDIEKYIIIEYASLKINCNINKNVYKE